MVTGVRGVVTDPSGELDGYCGEPLPLDAVVSLTRPASVTVSLQLKDAPGWCFRTAGGTSPRVTQTRRVHGPLATFRFDEPLVCSTRGSSLHGTVVIQASSTPTDGVAEQHVADLECP